MNLVLVGEELEAVYTEEKSISRLPPTVVDAFFYHVAAVAAAENTDDLLHLCSLAIKIERGHCLIELGERWSLALSFEAFPSKTVFVSIFRDALEDAT